MTLPFPCLLHIIVINHSLCKLTLSTSPWIPDRQFENDGTLLNLLNFFGQTNGIQLVSFVLLRKHWFDPPSFLSLWWPLFIILHVFGVCLISGCFMFWFNYGFLSLQKNRDLCKPRVLINTKATFAVLYFRTLDVTLDLKDPQYPDHDLGTLELSVTLSPKEGDMRDAVRNSRKITHPFISVYYKYTADILNLEQKCSIWYNLS